MKFTSDRQRRAVFSQLNKFASRPIVVSGYSGSKIYADPSGSDVPVVVMEGVPVAEVKDTAILAGEGYKLSPSMEDVIRMRNRDILAGMPVYSLPVQKEYIPGGLADGRSDDDFCPVQLEKGIQVEMEHVVKFTDKGNKRKPKETDIAKAKEISKDHLSEIPDYYDRLELLENNAKEDGVFVDVIEEKKLGV
jgi:hypothetical protein